MRKILSLLALMLLVVASSVPSVSAAPAVPGGATKLPGTLWERYPKMPATILHDGRTQYLAAYDTKRELGVYMDADTVAAYNLGQVRLDMPEVVSMKDFRNIPAEIDSALDSLPSVDSLPTDACYQMEIDHNLTMGGVEPTGLIRYNLRVQWYWDMCTNALTGIDGTPSHQTACWSCPGGAITQGTIVDPTRHWVKGQWNFTFECAPPLKMTKSHFIKDIIERNQSIWSWG